MMMPSLPVASSARQVAETDTAHQLAMNLYKKYASLFKTALGRA